MKLLNARFAVVPEAKLIRYLLDPAHPVGGSKARFFLRFGFKGRAWSLAADALRRHACNNEVVERTQTQYGIRFVVDGLMETPSGSILNIRSVWFIDHKSKIPRFVTAHPLPKK